MSNDTPPRACLADFGFMALSDPFHPPWDGAIRFKSPELLVPSKFGMTNVMATPEADVYAFGMVIFQVGEQDHGHHPFFIILSRFSRVKLHSVAFGRRSWDTGWLKGNVRPNQRMPRPSGSLIHCGASSNAAGTATRDCDQGLQRL